MGAMKELDIAIRDTANRIAGKIDGHQTSEIANMLHKEISELIEREFLHPDDKLCKTDIDEKDYQQAEALETAVNHEATDLTRAVAMLWVALNSDNFHLAIAQWQKICVQASRLEDAVERFEKNKPQSFQEGGKWSRLSNLC